MAETHELLVAFELHSIDRIRAALDAGIDVRIPIQGKLPVDWLTEMYTRSDRFPECLRILLERGAVLADPVIALVLLNAAPALSAALRADPALLELRVNMVSAFTPLIGASLLHVAAEYGHVQVARVLLEHGANVNASAAVDQFGFNGHTAIFHAVNSHENRSRPILQLLLEAGARADIFLPGITWGAGFEWETTVFNVTPCSYAQFGLLPQMHRAERDIYENIRLILGASGRTTPPLVNVPNRYLNPES